MSSPGPEDRSARRFTLVFLLVVLLGLSTSVAAAIVVDPSRIFRTGWIPSVLANDIETKPVEFRAIEPPPRAVVLGSSSVMKLRPACIEQLTGLPAFNFGLSGAVVDDMAVALRFIRSQGRAPIRELIIGIDVEAFDGRLSPIQGRRWPVEVRDYLGAGSGLSFDSATSTLFGWKAFRLAGTTLWHHLHAGEPAQVSYSHDGFITYDVMEAQMRAGTFSPQQKSVDVTGYAALSKPRVAQFREMIAAAHTAGADVDVFIPPSSPRNQSLLAPRARDVDALLSELERAGMIRYLRIARIEDVGGDPTGYFDGVHMIEANASRVLLAMFHRSHGCGI